MTVLLRCLALEVLNSNSHDMVLAEVSNLKAIVLCVSWSRTNGTSMGWSVCLKRLPERNHLMVCTFSSSSKDQISFGGGMPSVGRTMRLTVL